MSSMEVGVAVPGVVLINTWPEHIAGKRLAKKRKKEMGFVCNNMADDLKEHAEKE